MQIDLGIGIALIAIFISFVSLYLQWFRVRGPIIDLLNQGEQRAVLRPYEGLPETIQQRFPEYQEKYPGYALVSLYFGNTGDRAGLIKILKVQVDNPLPVGSPEKDQIKVSFYNHSLVPASDIVNHDLVLRNIPPIDAQKEINLVANIEWGGPNPRTAKYQRKGMIDGKLKVILHPSALGRPKSKD